MDYWKAILSYQQGFVQFGSREFEHASFKN